MASLVLAGVLGVLLSTQNVKAGTLYDFIQRSTEDVLATLDLDGDAPWINTDVLSLTFTDAGNAIFGLGTDPLDGSIFDTHIRGFQPDGVADPDGGLIGVGSFGLNQEGLIIDTNPPDGSDTLTITAGAEVGDADFILTNTVATGDWNFVPEPGSLGLAFMATVGLCACRRRRQS